MLYRDATDTQYHSFTVIECVSVKAVRTVNHETDGTDRLVP